ncbi:hypothetical protein TNCV_354071 [Trichonephila clavipes]|uniref:Uncharacterized protein n=1 Tax=Trichonephila clavipes TaxID=2585209 RepID=A0A8X6W0R2_TRICX|nr:hypothetical protein TNCV_354071 [Trichonephila clavipes]
MYENLLRLKCPLVGVVWKLKQSSSLDHSSKLRGPSPKARVLLNSATLTFTPSLIHMCLRLPVGYGHKLVAGVSRVRILVPLKSLRVAGCRCTLNMSKLKCPTVGVVW